MVVVVKVVVVVDNKKSTGTWSISQSSDTPQFVPRHLLSGYLGGRVIEMLKHKTSCKTRGTGTI